ncbi:hypothetical protein ACLKA7_001006 [Drosophila subpalustris]
MGLSIAQSSILAAVGNQAYLLAGKSCVRLPHGVHYKKVHGFALSHARSLTRLLLLYNWKWCAAPVKPLFSCFGHSSRVICAIIVEYDSEVFVISGGEDSFICVWSQSGDMLFKRRQHFGAPIWRLGYDSKSYVHFKVRHSEHGKKLEKQTALQDEDEEQILIDQAGVK